MYLVELEDGQVKRLVCIGNTSNANAFLRNNKGNWLKYEGKVEVKYFYNPETSGESYTSVAFFSDMLDLLPYDKINLLVNSKGDEHLIEFHYPGPTDRKVSLPVDKAIALIIKNVNPIVFRLSSENRVKRELLSEVKKLAKVVLK